MKNVFDILSDRGFIEQTTHDSELKNYLSSEKITCYIGFDPTAPSLHIGSLIPIMALAHMRQNGHRTIAVIGGGTGCIGDPSGKTEMRRIMSLNEINRNVDSIKQQLSNLKNFNGENILILNNADWLTNVDYIQFIRDIGRHFSVNKMIKAESYKSRLDSDSGLNFIEFNYMIIQAYDFKKLYENYGCCLQMGGKDQWGNIIAGIDLVRKKYGKTVFGMTFPLLTTSNGNKMGKTSAGTVWLNSSMTSPYDYYQFWINSVDKDLERFISLFTFLPMEEIKQISLFDEEELNYAKSVLAFETTCLMHGEKEGIRAHQAALTMFGQRTVPKHIFPSSSIPRGPVNSSDDSVPTVKMKIDQFIKGIPAFKLFTDSGLTKSASFARRLIQQGGGYINGKRLNKFDYKVDKNDINDMKILLRAGKKQFVKIKIV